MPTRLTSIAAGAALATLAAGAALTISTLALAQPSPPPSGPDRQAWMQQRIATRQAEISRDLTILLDIKPGQQGAFDAWLAAIAPPPRPHDAATPAGAAETEPARLDRMAAIAQRRAAMIQGRIDATRRFYAALDPHQQERFDALMRLRRAGRAMHRRQGTMGWRDGAGA